MCVCFFLNSASWGAIPSACLVRCTCALKYIIIIINYMYIAICEDGGAVGFVDFTKLSFALSSLAQPLTKCEVFQNTSS